jgi:hypothetical protein
LLAIDKERRMNDEPGSECDLLAQLESLMNRSIGVSYRDFEGLLREGNASITVSHWHQVLNFACDQMGFWEAEWFFSPAHSPNTVAKIEMEGWRILWQVIFDILVENVPETKDLLEREQQLRLFEHSLRRGVEYNKTRPLRKLTASVLSQGSFVFKKVGFHSIARNLYAWCLYPKGTVARP